MNLFRTRIKPVNVVNFETTAVDLIDSDAVRRSLSHILRSGNHPVIVTVSTDDEERVSTVYDILNRTNRRRSRLGRKTVVPHAVPPVTKKLANGYLGEHIPVVYGGSMTPEQMEEIIGVPAVSANAYPLVLAQFIQDAGRAVRVIYLNDVGNVVPAPQTGGMTVDHYRQEVVGRNGDHLLTADSARLLQEDLRLDHVLSVDLARPKLVKAAFDGKLRVGQPGCDMIRNYNSSQYGSRAEHRAKRSLEKDPDHVKGLAPRLA